MQTSKTAKHCEPLPRFAHISQCVGSNVVVQGGRTRHASEESVKNLTAIVEVLDLFSETWEQKQVTGYAPPPATQSSASAVLQGDLFAFGGWNGRHHFHTLRRLDLKTWRWAIASPQNSPGAPTPKRDCGMVAFSGENLAVFGGYGAPLEQPAAQQTASFVKGTENQGWLNEFHVYNLAEGIIFNYVRG